MVFAIAPSAIQSGLIWAGTNDGKVWYTSDGGANWNDVTKNISGLPAWSVIAKIEPSHFDAGDRLRRGDFHLMDDRDAVPLQDDRLRQDLDEHVRRSAVEASARLRAVIAENPNQKGMLFAGTGHGFYYTLDDGVKWKALQTGLPAAPVTWVVVQKQAHDVVLSTYGRGCHHGRHHAAGAAGPGGDRRGAAVRAAPGVPTRSQRQGAVHLLRCRPRRR